MPILAFSFSNQITYTLAEIGAFNSWLFYANEDVEDEHRRTCHRIIYLRTYVQDHIQCHSKLRISLVEYTIAI